MIMREDIWLIMTKDNKMIAKGVPRNRYLVKISDEKDKKRMLTYSSEKMAINGFTNSGFYNSSGYERSEDFKAVKAIMVIEIEDSDE